MGSPLSDRRLAAGVAILGVIAYTLLVGADAAVVRAAIMGIIVVFGVIVGRKGVAHNTLAVAIIVMTALNPYTVWNVGFQLSVAATLGLIVYGGRFERVAQRALERCSQRSEPDRPSDGSARFCCSRWRRRSSRCP